MWYSRIDTNQPKGASSLMDSITQDMKYRYSLMKYAEKPQQIFAIGSKIPEHQRSSVSPFTK